MRCAAQTMHKGVENDKERLKVKLPHMQLRGPDSVRTSQPAAVSPPT